MVHLPSVVTAPHSDGGTSPRAVYVNLSAPHTPYRNNYAHGCAVFTGRCRDLSEHQKWRPSVPGLGVTWGGQANVATRPFTVAAATVMAIGFVGPAAAHWRTLDGPVTD